MSVAYGSHQVLDRLSLTVENGIVALLGQNGAGKTTLIDVLSTLRRPDSGTALVAGYDVARSSASVRGLIGVTGQFACVDDILTARENLVMVGQLGGLSAKAAQQRARALLEQFALEVAADRAAGTFSGGMRRRLDLAMSLIRAPRVLFLDEPTTGLDASSRLTLWDEVRTLADDRTTVVLTTQYLEEADALADRVAVLHGGRIVADGTPDALKSSLGGTLVEVLDEHGRVQRTQPTDGTAADAAAALATLPDHTRVTVRNPTLDEVFLKLTTTPANTLESEEISA